MLLSQACSWKTVHAQARIPKPLLPGGTCFSRVPSNGREVLAKLNTESERLICTGHETWSRSAWCFDAISVFESSTSILSSLSIEEFFRHKTQQITRGEVLSRSVEASGYQGSRVLEHNQTTPDRRLLRSTALFLGFF